MRALLTKSLRNDPEQWWIGDRREMKKTAAISNGSNLYRLIGNTRRWKSIITGMIEESNGADSLRAVDWCIKQNP